VTDTYRITEEVPVAEDVDICVLGGSCTGVFAAVRAARLGARVALVEKQAALGGVATIVCVWHSVMDTEFERKSIGVRDTRHVRSRYQVTTDDVLYGRRFGDAIANGSYRADIHHQDLPGITFLYLDGRSSYVRPGRPAENDRWRGPTQTDPTFYQVPLRALIPRQVSNVLFAGRMVDAEKTAFGALRVMVNTNQMGEAAGVAAFAALEVGCPVQELDATTVRRRLADGGSVVI
jgi:hypothetical protein